MQIVLLFAMIIYVWYRQIERAINTLVKKFSVSTIVFGLIITLGFFSIVISAILAAILLVEFICALSLERSSKIDICVVACFAIGMGASLTPIEENSTIVVSKLFGTPYYAGFDFLVNILIIYVIPALIILGIIGIVLFKKDSAGIKKIMECHLQQETIRQVVVRSGKVYLIIVGLVFLGKGFKPLVLDYMTPIQAEGLYWINIGSAVLDNATIAALRSYPPFLSCRKKCRSGTYYCRRDAHPWKHSQYHCSRKTGDYKQDIGRKRSPFGLILMVCFFGILFIPQYLELA